MFALLGAAGIGLFAAGPRPAQAAVVKALSLEDLARKCHGDGRPECPILEGLAEQPRLTG